MLTARAAGVVLRNISQVDSFKAEWMEEYFTKVRHKHSNHQQAAEAGCSSP
jgi:hypothetical protein